MGIAPAFFGKGLHVKEEYRRLRFGVFGAMRGSTTINGATPGVSSGAIAYKMRQRRP
jgi:hypothetical protein